MSASSPVERPRRGSSAFAWLQRLGRSLMLPIALLPAAGLLLRLGQPDVLGRFHIRVLGSFFQAMSAAGDAVFSNLALLFAVGVAIGFARKADGSTALSAVAGYLVMKSVFTTMSPIVLAGKLDAAGKQSLIDYGVFAGLLVGVLTAYLFDRYHAIELPAYLGFFSGRRFVPIVVTFASLVLGFGLSYCYPAFNWALTHVATFIAGSGVLGAFVYGFLNRMLIPLGLHHILNFYIWFMYGSYNTPHGVLAGELTRFAAGDPTAGRLTSGFYPVIMFGLPGAALAMIHCARRSQRKLATGILLSAGLTAFLTGITEPLEFAFMFVAFPLYVVHALLTGLSLAIAYELNVHLGFSFSAGLIDLLLYGHAPAAHHVWLLVAQGVVFFVLYYVLFRFAITKWNMRTPGREPEAERDTALDEDAETQASPAGPPASGRGDELVRAFGGRDNLLDVSACITRLRIEVADTSRVDRGALRSMGAAGVVEVGRNVQAIFGPQADSLRAEMAAALATGALTDAVDADPASRATSTSTTLAIDPASSGDDADPTLVRAPLGGRLLALDQVPDTTFARGLVGPGMAIEPDQRMVEVVAPVTGTIAQMWPHGAVITTDAGVGVLVHLGIDTVTLKGQGFTPHVAKGDRVQVGQMLIGYDVAQVSACGRSPIVVVVAPDAARNGDAVTPLSGDDRLVALDALFEIG